MRRQQKPNNKHYAGIGAKRHASRKMDSKETLTPRYYPCRIVGANEDIYEQHRLRRLRLQQPNTDVDGWDETTHALIQVLEYPLTYPFEDYTSDCIVVKRSRLLPYYGNSSATNDKENEMRTTKAKGTSAATLSKQANPLAWSLKLWKIYVQQRQSDLARHTASTSTHNDSGVLTPTDIQAGHYYLQRILEVAQAGGLDDTKESKNQDTTADSNNEKGDVTKNEEVDVGDLDVPYSLNFSDDEDYAAPRVLTLASLLERQREPLRPGDVIEYTHPIFVNGDKRGRRQATVLSTDPNRRPMIYLDNGDVLPDDILVARVQTYCQQTGQLLEHPGVFRSIEDFRMQVQQVATSDGKTIDAAEGIRRQAEHIKGILQQGKRELVEWGRNREMPTSPESTTRTTMTKTVDLPKTSSTSTKNSTTASSKVRSDALTNVARKNPPATSKREGISSFHLAKRHTLPIPKSAQTSATRVFPPTATTSAQPQCQTANNSSLSLPKKSSSLSNGAKGKVKNQPKARQRPSSPPNVTKASAAMNKPGRVATRTNALSISLSDSSDASCSSSSGSSNSSCSSSPALIRGSSKPRPEDRLPTAPTNIISTGKPKIARPRFDSDSSASEDTPFDIERRKLGKTKGGSATPARSPKQRGLRQQPARKTMLTEEQRRDALESHKIPGSGRIESSVNPTATRSPFNRPKRNVSDVDDQVTAPKAPSGNCRPAKSTTSSSNGLVLTKCSEKASPSHRNARSGIDHVRLRNARNGVDPVPLPALPGKPRDFSIEHSLESSIDLTNTPSDEDVDDNDDGGKIECHPRKEESNESLKGGVYVSAAKSRLPGHFPARKVSKKRDAESVDSDALNVDEEEDLFDTDSSSDGGSCSPTVDRRIHRKRKHGNDLSHNDSKSPQRRRQARKSNNSPKYPSSGQLQIKQISPRSRRVYDDW